MSFQTPITIAEALGKIRDREYVLPAIQREFVWSRDKITRLFDSLMRGYPIGSFLMWKVEPANASKFVFYDVMRDYHERDHAHCAPTGPAYQCLPARLGWSCPASDGQGYHSGCGAHTRGKGHGRPECTGRGRWGPPGPPGRSERQHLRLRQAVLDAPGRQAGTGDP